MGPSVRSTVTSAFNYRSFDTAQDTCVAYRLWRRSRNQVRCPHSPYQRHTRLKVSDKYTRPSARSPHPELKQHKVVHQHNRSQCHKWTARSDLRHFRIRKCSHLDNRCRFHTARNTVRKHHQCYRGQIPNMQSPLRSRRQTHNSLPQYHKPPLQPGRSALGSHTQLGLLDGEILLRNPH